MAIFSKNKKDEGGLPVAGCGAISQDEYARIYDELFGDVVCDSDVEKFFYYGYLAGLAFVSCPEGTDMHGEDAFTFAKNAYTGCWQDEVEKTMNVKLAEAAKNVLDAFGIEGNIIIAGNFDDSDDEDGDE